MPDDDRTPKPGRPSDLKVRGRTSVPDPRDSGKVVDPPTVRSTTPPGSGSGAGAGAGSSIRGNRRKDRPEVPPLPVPGDRVGDFGLEEAIGAGGMGAVFRAVDIKLDRQVALKILPPDQAVDAEVVRRYYQEGRAAARLDDENIARVYSIGHDGRYHYIAFEYIEGTTIRQRVEAGGPLAVGDAINYTLQIANALVHASARGVVHRDIKPSNIIVTPQGRAKLVDMGLARRFERGEDAGLTQSGMTLGTFDYISPEQARDPRDVDVRADLYSLGCTLFHMLSGRPPFPEGTVLQKLLQHQEEPPPDIRMLNPKVPDDLASILVKLMAKDRDRRYQTPEQLVRDLFTVAGSLGLRSLNPEGLDWMAPGARAAPAWTRQLVWGVPAMAFALILAGLAWWDDGTGPAPSSINESAVAVPPNPPRKTDAPPRSKPQAAVVEAPGEYEVYSREDLHRVIAEAPPKSTILLAEKGPYEIRDSKSRPFQGLDLTIRAEAGVRPVIRLARDPDATTHPGPGALIDLVGGRLTIEGVDFLVEGVETLAALRAEDAELVVRRCSFRRPPGSATTSGARRAAIAIKSTRSTTRPASGDRRASLSVESSEFDGGQIGMLISGAVEVTVRDGTFGPAKADQATIWAENSNSEAGPADFGIARVSVLAGAGPVFRFSGVAPRVRVMDSVFAPPSADSAPPVLVAIDSPDRPDWRGTDNVYGKFAAFLQLLRGPALRGSIRTFEAWAEDPSTVREWGSIAVERTPWEDRNPLEALAAGPPRSTRAFQLALTRREPPRPGARQAPTGPLPAPVAPAGAAGAAVEPSPSASNLAEAASGPAERPSKPPVESVRPREVASTTTPAAARPAPPSIGADDAMREMPLTLPVPKTARDLDVDPSAISGELAPMPMPMPIEPDRPQPPASPAPTTPVPVPAGPARPAPAAPPAVAAEPTVIRSPEELREALGRPGPGPRTVILPAGADWTIPACRVRGMSSWVIQAEPGPVRPRLRFQPDPAPAFPPDAWSAWMTVQASGLRLEGIDLVMAAPDAEASAGPAAGRRRALFALAPGTVDLTLVDCTLTIEGDSSPSAAVALLAGEVGGEGRLRVENCLLRVGGDLIDVAGGRRLDLEVDNALIASGGPMVHAHGSPEGRAAEGLKLVLRQVTARVAGGLAQLQSDPTEPELPVASINARDVVLTTGDPEVPLIRVDGQGPLDQLRGLIRWDGRSVAYHQVNIYRRDQSTLPGVVPTVYDRDSWNLRLGDREQAPIHGDLKFPAAWPADRAPWALQPDDLRLPAESPAVGADLRDIPSPPRSRAN